MRTTSTFEPIVERSRAASRRTEPVVADQEISLPARRFPMVAALFASLAVSCAADVPRLTDQLADEWILEGAELTAELLHYPGLTTAAHVTPVLRVDSPDASRVGLMFDATSTPAVHVRASRDGGGVFSSWEPALLTFREDIAHNGHADLQPGTTHVQLRFAGVEANEISYLMVDAFRLEVDPGVAADSLVVRTQALAAAAAVDVTRAEWGARDGRCTTSTSPYRMAIHHTATPTNDSLTVPQRMRQMQNYHMDNRAFCDLGYHFVIGRDGVVYEGRAEGLQGAHVLNHNSGNTGISFMGTYVTDVAPGSMMNAAAKTIRAVSDHYGIAINRDRIKGHREHSGASTACPGDDIHARMDELLTLAQAYEFGEPEPVPGVLRGAIYHGDDIGDLGNRLEGATVTLQGGESAVADGGGWYRFDVEPGEYEVEAAADGFTTESIIREVSAGTTTWGSIRLYPRVEVGGTARGYVFWVDDPSEIADAVSDPSRRVAGAEVALNPGGYVATTDENGHYQIELPSGVYSVRAAADGYDDGVREHDVNVVAGEVAWGSTHVLRRQEGGVVSPPAVSISDPPDGIVVELDRVTVSGSVAHEAELVTLTVAGRLIPAQSGSFSHPVDLVEGENRVEVVAEDALGQTGTDAVTVTFLPPPGGIDGLVYDVTRGQAERVPGASIFIGDLGEVATTDAAGAFDVDLERGEYALRIEAEEFLPHEGRVTIEAGARRNLRLGLEPRGAPIPDHLEISSPEDGAVVNDPRVDVTGSAGGADLQRVTVNGFIAELDVDGIFQAQVLLEEGVNIIEAVAYGDGSRPIATTSVEVTYQPEDEGEGEGDGEPGEGDGEPGDGEHETELPSTDEDDDEGGCGCAAAAGTSGALVWLLLLAVTPLGVGRRRCAHPIPSATSDVGERGLA